MSKTYAYHNTFGFGEILNCDKNFVNVKFLNNITRKIVTLNLELIKLDIKYLDYVIVHELSHLIYPNHSKDFWNVVSKYCPNYKIYRKEMKNLI